MRVFDLLGAASILVIAGVASTLGYRHATAGSRDQIVSRTVDGTGRRDLTLLSRTHTIDRIFESMQGPHSNQSGIRLSEGPEPELLWITRVRSELVARDGSTASSREFFCHSNLTFTPEAVSPRRGDGTFTSVPDLRLITLVPGRLDVRLPDGFGVPVYSDEPLDYYSMSLNLNQQDQVRRVRFRTSISYVRDRDTPRPLRPLFRRALYAYEPIGKRSPHSMCVSADHPGAACGVLAGQKASNAFLASIGTKNTMHWMIPPGHYESRVKVTDQFEIPYDTTVHYVTAHLHPYAKSVSLFDSTSKVAVFTIRPRDFGDRRGVAHMDEWRSSEGIELRTHHEYELHTIYENPTAHAIDAMSILYLYAIDKTFEAVQGTTRLATR